MHTTTPQNINVGFEVVYLSRTCFHGDIHVLKEQPKVVEEHIFPPTEFALDWIGLRYNMWHWWDTDY